MADVLCYWLKWHSIEVFMSSPWGWPLCEALHFVGLCLLIGENSYDVIARDIFLQVKLLFMLLAGLNLLAFYLTGAARAVDALGPDAPAPFRARVMAAASLFLWIGVIVLGRLIPLGL